MRHFAAGLCILVTILLFPVTAGLFLFDQTLLKPDVILDTLKEGNAYEMAFDIAVDQTFTAKLPTELPLPPEVVEETVKDIVRETVTPQLIRIHTEALVLEVFHIVNTPGATIEDSTYSINLRSAKQKLSASLNSHLESYVASLPECTTATDIEAMINTKALTCRPKGIPTELLASTFRTAITEALTLLPEEIGVQDVLKLIDQKDRAEADRVLVQIQGWRQIMRIVMIAGFASLALLLLLIGVLERPFQRSMRWIGMTVGCIALPYFLLALASLAVGIDDFTYISRDAVPSVVAPMLNSLAILFVDGIRDRIMWVTGILTFAGIGLFVVSSFLRSSARSLDRSSRNDLGK
ncbi:MAG: hypothetical protein HYV34_03460 [Candidatus Kerfeldbacteria bacterium]|nr:hypothetical protein [Candidatus Kerfeldbacteria bacterium]